MTAGCVSRLLPEAMLAGAARLKYEHLARARSRRAWRGVIRDVERVTATCLDRVAEGDEGARSATRMRAELWWMLGIDLVRERPPVPSSTAGVIDAGEYRIERLTFESLPGLVVTANLYVPGSAKTPLPCVVYLCGHMPNRDGAKSSLQERYLWYPRNGFACLVLDPLGYGEVPGLHRGTHDLSMWSWISMGYTPAGVEVWNGIRAIDYLESRPEIDAARVGVTGISGGGATTWHLAAADERVMAAVASCSSYSLGHQARRRLVREQCDCVFLPNVFGFDLPTVATLVVPRPLLLTGGTRDPIFPAAGYRWTYRGAREAYRRLGGAAAEDRIRLVEARCGHEDPAIFLTAAREWMVRWLAPGRGPTPRPDLAEKDDIRPGAELRCLASPPSKALNYSVHVDFAPTAQLERPADAVEWRERRARLLDDLKTTVFRWMPQSGPEPDATPVHETPYYARSLAKFEAWRLESEPGVDVRLLGLRALGKRMSGPKLVVVRSREEGWQYPDLEPLLPLLGVVDTFVLYPRFVEAAMTPARYSEIERTAVLAGRTIAALQTWDTMQAVRWLIRREGEDCGPVVIAGRESATIPSLYAAILCEMVKGLILCDPPSSHRRGPPLLSVLRTTDMWETAALIAPRPLGFVGQPPREYEGTREILHGAGLSTSVSSGRSLFETVSEVIAQAALVSLGCARDGYAIPSDEFHKVPRNTTQEGKVDGRP